MKVEQIETFETDWAAPGDWAAMYRAAGLQIVPSYMPGEHPNWKRPKLADWKTLQESVVPDATFQRWYGSQGEYAKRLNMGLVTGRASGNVFVIDLDDYKTPAARAWWIAIHTARTRVSRRRRLRVRVSLRDNPASPPRGQALYRGPG